MEESEAVETVESVDVVEESETAEEVIVEKETEEESTPEQTEVSEQGEEAAEPPTAEPTGEEKKVKAFQTKADDEKRKRQAEQQEHQETKRRLDEMEAKFNQRSPQQVDENRLNDYLGNLRDESDTLRLEGRHLEADLKDEERTGLISDYRQFKQQSTAVEQTRQAETQTKQQQENMVKSIDEAATFYAKEKGIPEATWTELGAIWQETLSADPLLARSFWEKAQYQGPVSAIEYAYSEVQKIAETRREDAEKVKKQRDAEKKRQPSVGGVPSKSVKTYEQLMGLGTEQVVAYKKNNPKHYQRLLEKSQ